MYRSRNKSIKGDRDPRVVAADLALFEPLTRYAYLPANHLRHLDPRYWYIPRRLGDFQHDLPGYLIRVRAKMHEQSFYKLGPLGVQHLKDHQLLDDETAENMHRSQAGRGKLDEHNAFAAMAVAQIEISAKKFGVRFIPHTEILKKKGLHSFAVPVGQNNKTTVFLRPDALFGLEYAEGIRYFALEYDRGSESVEGTWQRKFDDYKIAKGVIAKHLGIPRWNVLCMIPKGREGKKDRVANIKALLKERSPDYWFYELQGNAHFEHVPPPSDDLFTLPWTRVGAPDMTLKGD